MKQAVTSSRRVNAPAGIAASFLALVLAAPLVVQPVTAQTPKRTQAALIGKRDLSAPPADCPVPMPQDSRFIFGYESQWLHKKPVTYLKLESKVQPAQLVPWFEQAVRSHGYTVSKPAPNKSGAIALFASKGGSGVTLSLVPITQGTEQLTSIQVRYNQ